MSSAAPEIGPRRRALNISVGQARSALRAVQPIQSKLKPWQMRAAWLRASMEHNLAARRPVEALIMEADDIAADVAAERRRYEQIADQLPDQIRLHSRFQDVGRALGTVLKVLNGIAAGGGPTAG